MERARVTEVWRAGTLRAEVLSGPAPVACDEPLGDERLEFTVRLGEQPGHCFIMHSEAIHLSQLTERWVQQALCNLVLRDGPGRVRERLCSAAGLHLRLDDAADVEA
jgi:hypothetical protein